MAKTITLILHRADRKAWEGGPTTLEVKDPSQKSKFKPKKLAAGSHVIEVNLELPFDAGQVYAISVHADGHRAAWQLFKRRFFLREQGGIRIEVDDSSCGSCLFQISRLRRISTKVMRSCGLPAHQRWLTKMPRKEGLSRTR